MLNLRNLMCFVAVTLVGAALLLGCSSQPVSQPAAGPNASAEWEIGLDKDVVASLSQLNADDRTAALSQKLCPVSDAPLGSMGKPPKVTVEGHEVFLCCDGCEEQLRNESAKYLAKLKPE